MGISVWFVVYVWKICLSGMRSTLHTSGTHRPHYSCCTSLENVELNKIRGVFIKLSLKWNALHFFCVCGISRIFKLVLNIFQCLEFIDWICRQQTCHNSERKNVHSQTLLCSQFTWFFFFFRLNSWIFIDNTFRMFYLKWNSVSFLASWINFRFDYDYNCNHSH